jgi:SAM-dependent methyltransferase
VLGRFGHGFGASLAIENHPSRRILETFMKARVASSSESYLRGRRDPKSGFGYGLSRRTNMLLETIDRHAPLNPHLDVVDFGCADGAMLQAVADHLGNRFRRGVGLDVFRAGKPNNDSGKHLDFRVADLFRQYPFPVEDELYDVAIASAFLKHHPEPARFLAEVARVLRPSGCAILLDPRPFVVQIGCRVGRFNPDYNPSIWSRATVERWLAESRLNLVIRDFRRYWVAPTYGFYRLGVERVLPGFVEHAVALHQCITLVKPANAQIVGSSQ